MRNTPPPRIGHQSLICHQRQLLRAIISSGYNNTRQFMRYQQLACNTIATQSHNNHHDCAKHHSAVPLFPLSNNHISYNITITPIVPIIVTTIVPSITYIYSLAIANCKYQHINHTFLQFTLSPSPVTKIYIIVIDCIHINQCMQIIYQSTIYLQRNHHY